jgi:4-amino-4-deoxychorismate lyase
MSTALQVFVDGESCSESWTQDRGLQFGDGLFETMQVRGGNVRFESLHRARLTLGCSRLAITADHAGIWKQVAEQARVQGQALFKLQLTRGGATARGYAPTGSERTRVILSVFPPPSRAEIPAEIHVVPLDNVLGENPQLAGLKHCNRLEQVLARASLQGKEAFEGMMSSSSGRLISGTMSNVFLELDGGLVTPEVDRCGIAGVLRAVVLREARVAGIAVQVADISWSALDRCTSMALSNARIGLLPVNRVAGRPLAINAQLRALSARIETLEQ